MKKKFNHTIKKALTLLITISMLFINVFTSSSQVSAASSGATVNYPVSGSTYIIVPKLNTELALEVRDASKKNGEYIILANQENTANQKFIFTKNSDGSYTIKASHSKKIIGVYGSNTNATWIFVTQYTNKNSNKQKWILEDAGDGYFYIKSKYNKKVLEPRYVQYNGRTFLFPSHSSFLFLYDSNQEDVQKFKLVKQ